MGFLKVLSPASHGASGYVSWDLTILWTVMVLLQVQGGASDSPNEYFEVLYHSSAIIHAHRQDFWPRNQDSHTFSGQTEEQAPAGPDNSMLLSSCLSLYSPSLSPCLFTLYLRIFKRRSSLTLKRKIFLVTRSWILKIIAKHTFT